MLTYENTPFSDDFIMRVQMDKTVENGQAYW